MLKLSILVKSGPIGDDFANDQKNRNNLLNDYDFVEDYDYLTGFDAQGTDFKIRIDLVSFGRFMWHELCLKLIEFIQKSLL